MPAGQIIIFTYCILSIFTTNNIEFFSISSIIMVVLSIILSSLSYFWSEQIFYIYNIRHLWYNCTGIPWLYSYVTINIV